jgi:hypothetical protein
VNCRFSLSYICDINLDLLIWVLNFQAEGIFRINPGNDQEEHVRDQLNRGVVPEDIDVHCLASLIKVNIRHPIYKYVPATMPLK